MHALALLVSITVALVTVVYARSGPENPSLPAPPATTTRTDAPVPGTPPRPMFRPWPKSAVIMNAQGANAVSTYVVTVRFCVEKDGTVTHPEIVGATPSGRYNRIALNTIGYWEFYPAHLNGQPVRRCGISQRMIFPHMTASAPSPSTSTATRTTPASASAPAAAIAVDVVPIYRESPTYPANALKKRISGCVKVIFGINADGTTTNLRVWTHYPSPIFDQAAIQTLSHWRFRVTDGRGRPTALGNVTQEIVFAIGGEQSEKMHWLCKQPRAHILLVSAATAGAAQTIRVRPHGDRADEVSMPVPAGENLKNGWVKVGFCVANDGHVTHPKIKDASPKRLYDRAAVAALSAWEFSARKRGGKAVTTCGLVYTIAVIDRSTLERYPVAILMSPMAVSLRDLEGGHSVGILPTGPVSVRFCINADGSIGDAKIVSTHAAKILQKAALTAIRSWQFWPRERNGNPVRTCGIEQTIHFRMSRDLLLADPREQIRERYQGSSDQFHFSSFRGRRRRNPESIPNKVPVPGALPSPGKITRDYVARPSGHAFRACSLRRSACAVRIALTRVRNDVA